MRIKECQKIIDIILDSKIPGHEAEWAISSLKEEICRVEKASAAFRLYLKRKEEKCNIKQKKN